MSKADSKITTAEVSTPLADALFDLESELHSVKNLSHAIFMMGAVAELVGIEVGVVSGVINLESSGVEASDWRLRHDQAYHEA
jgi:hypothetical protein